MQSPYEHTPFHLKHFDIRPGEGSISMSSNGRYVAMAEFRQLGFVDLDNLSPNLRKIQVTKVFNIPSCGVLEYSPHSATNLLVTYNHELNILDLETRKVTAKTGKVGDGIVKYVHWNPQQDLIASCSAGRRINIWDCRSSEKSQEISTFSSMGTSIVKWNRRRDYLLASVHGSDVKVWDTRKSGNPLKQLVAAVFKYQVLSLDWSYRNENELATCSQEKMVKLWDISQPQEKQIKAQLITESPTGVVRYTPVQEGLLTVPHRQDFSCSLWSVHDFTTPVEIFTGHTDVIKYADWRKRGDHYQLVTWAQDLKLGVWPITDEMVEDLASSNLGSLTLRRQTSAQNAQSSSSLPTLAQEFQLIQAIAGVRVDSSDVSQRSCIVTVTGDKYRVELLIHFPMGYPTAPPSFEFTTTNMLADFAKKKIKDFLSANADAMAAEETPSLQSCMLQLSRSLDQLIDSVNSFAGLDAKSEPDIPCPRTCSCSFSATGQLLWFVNFPERKWLPQEDPPRTHHALTNWLKEEAVSTLLRQQQYQQQQQQQQQQYQQQPHEQFSYGSGGNVLAYHTPSSPSFLSLSGQALSPAPIHHLLVDQFELDPHDHQVHQHHQLQQQQQQQQQPLFPPTIARTCVFSSDLSVTVPISYQLAKRYKLTGTVAEMCVHNESVAMAANRTDLAQAWKLMKACVDPLLLTSRSSDLFKWQYHPLGRPLLEKLIGEFIKRRDIQSIAMMAAVVSLSIAEYQATRHGGSAGERSGDGAVTGENSSVMSETSSFKIRASDSNSQPAAATTATTMTAQQSASSSSGNQPATSAALASGNPVLVDMLSYSLLLDRFRTAYAAILHRWQMFEAFSTFYKQLAAPRTLVPAKPGIGFEVNCRCGALVTQGPACRRFNHFAFKCSLCRSAVRGLSMFCLVCGHGGHIPHMQDWFSQHKECPEGCGCCCNFAMSELYSSQQ